MFNSKTSRSIRDLIQIHDDNPGRQEFDIKLLGSNFFDRLVYKQVTILESKITFSGFRSRIKEIQFSDIKSVTRKRKNNDTVNVINEDGRTTSFRFKNNVESRKFFDLMGYYLSVDPTRMNE